MRESGPRPEMAGAARTPTESRARLKRLGALFLAMTAGAAMEHGRASMSGEPEPTVDAKAEEVKADADAKEQAATEKSEVEAITTEWGFNPREIHITSEDLLRLPTITNWDTLNPLQDQKEKEYEHWMTELSDDPNSLRPPELIRLEAAFSTELKKNWAKYDSLNPAEQLVAYSSLSNSYAVDTAVERQQLAEAVAKTEVKVEDDRITAVYHPKPGEDVVIHEWLPDQSPLEAGVRPMETSLWNNQVRVGSSREGMYELSKSLDLYLLSRSESPEKSEWFQQVLVNEIQQELLFADLPGAEEK